MSTQPPIPPDRADERPISPAEEDAGERVRDETEGLPSKDLEKPS